MFLAGGNRRLRYSFYDCVTQRVQKIDLCHIANGDKPPQASEGADPHCLRQCTVGSPLACVGGP